MDSHWLYSECRHLDLSELQIRSSHPSLFSCNAAKNLHYQQLHVLWYMTTAYAKQSQSVIKPSQKATSKDNISFGLRIAWGRQTKPETGYWTRKVIIRYRLQHKLDAIQNLRDLRKNKVLGETIFSTEKSNDHTTSNFPIIFPVQLSRTVEFYLLIHTGNHPRDNLPYTGSWRTQECCSRKHQDDSGPVDIHPYL